MGNINWLIIQNKERGSEYGIGTFIKQLASGLSLMNNINTYIIDIDNKRNGSVLTFVKNNVHYIEIPLTFKISGNDTILNQKKAAKSIVRVIINQILPTKLNIIHLNYFFQSFIGEEFKNKLKCKLIFTQHLFIPFSNPELMQFDSEQHIYGIADYLVAVTKHGKAHMEKKGVSSNRIFTIYNGIDPSVLNKSGKDIKVKYGLTNDEKIILYSGRIDLIKGLPYLVQAFSKVLQIIPNCRLIFAGNGDFENLIKLTNSFSSKVSYLGFIPFEDIVDLYHESDVGVIPSLEEHCSYVALEMLHCGLPVVASSVGGLKEIFTHKSSAFLVETIIGNNNFYEKVPKVDEFAKYLIELLLNKNLRIKFSKNEITRAQHVFTQKIMVKNYLKLVS